MAVSSSVVPIEGLAAVSTGASLTTSEAVSVAKLKAVVPPTAPAAVRSTRSPSAPLVVSQAR